MEELNKQAILLLTEEMKEAIEDLTKRNPEAIATALLFAMCEVLTRRDYEHKHLSQEDILNVMKKANAEALILVDSVILSKPNDKEVIH
jgi:hypothetical protein